jgi:hypothetical protein
MSIIADSVNLIALLGEVGAKSAYLDIFDFLVATFGEKIFDCVSPSKFIQAVSGISSQELGQKLISLSSIPFDGMVRTKSFQSMCHDVTPQLSRYILSYVKEKSVKYVLEALWRWDCPNLKSGRHSSGYAEFAFLSWKLLQRFGKIAVSMFEGGHIHEVLAEYIVRKSESACLAKTLAVFNQQYARLHQNERSFFASKPKTRQLYDTYRQRGLSMTDLIGRIRRSKPAPGRGQSGYIHLVRSLLVLVPDRRSYLYDQQKTDKAPCLIKEFYPPRAAARLICDLGDADLTLANFLQSGLETFDIFCNHFDIRNVPDLYKKMHAMFYNARNIRGFEEKAAGTLIRLFNSRELNVIYERVLVLVSDEIRASGWASREIWDIVKRLEGGLRGLSILAKFLNVKVKLTAARSEIETLARRCEENARAGNLAVELIKFCTA